VPTRSPGPATATDSALGGRWPDGRADCGKATAGAVSLRGTDGAVYARVPVSTAGVSIKEGWRLDGHPVRRKVTRRRGGCRIIVDGIGLRRGSRSAHGVQEKVHGDRLRKGSRRLQKATGIVLITKRKLVTSRWTLSFRLHAKIPVWDDSC
jgi:hypothetical protein